MATFTIDSKNNIAAHSAVTSSTEDVRAFTTEKELLKLSADWRGSRLVEVWNSFAGVAPFTELKPVKKFTNRKTAVARVWAAVQRLSPNGSSSATDAAPGKQNRKKSAGKPAQRDRVHKGKTVGRSNKKAEVIAMMKRATGATLDEIVETTGWQKHTVRGFISLLGSKSGEKIESSKNPAGDRSYKIGK